MERKPFALVVFFFVTTALSGGADPNLVFNGSFEHGAGDWQLGGDAQVVRDSAYHGNAALRLRNGSARQDVSNLPAKAKFTCAAALKVQEVRPTAAAGYAYLAVYQLDDFDEVVAAHDFVQKAGTADWQPLSFTFTVADECRTVSVRCGVFQATGTAWFDGFTLVAGEKALDFSQIDADRMAAARELGLEPRANGNVAIFKDDIPPSGAPAPPDDLANLLRRADFGCAFLNSEQLADDRFLSRDLVDVVVLPYGASFPVKAADNFRRFLREGGKFFSTGGYAFDNLLERTAGGWKAPSPPRAPETDHAAWHYEVPAEELRGKGQITFSGFLKAAKLTGPGMAYFAVYQLAADGSLAEWKDVCQVRSSQDWKDYRYAFTVNPKAARIDLRAGLYQCQGVACFDDIRLIDQSGRMLLESDFEQAFDPDNKSLRHWARSSPRFCEVQSRTHHSGQRALRVRVPVTAAPPEQLNTRHGIPGDGLEVAPTQLGVFDADYHLERVHFAKAAPGQCVINSAIKLDGALEGHAASGVVGFDKARWIPLLNACDRYGRLRGAAGALLRHYEGAYAGSSWAFFGVTNRNLFAASEPEMPGVLQDTMRSLVHDTYFASLVSERACYRRGETVKLLATVFNGGRSDSQLRLTVEIYAREPASSNRPLENKLRAATPGDAGASPEYPRSAGLRPGANSSETHRAGSETGAPMLLPAYPDPLATLSTPITALPGQTNFTALEWKPARVDSDFHYVVGRLWDGKEVDRLESGFLVRDERVIASGPRLNLQNNYLRFGQRPLFLFGTDDWSYLFNTTRETPLLWLRDMRQRRDFGVEIYENLQFGIPASPSDTERLLRKVDGVAQLAQKFQQVYFPGLLIGQSVAVSDTELAREKEFCRAFAKRYAQVPGLIYYLNGDLYCALSEAVTPQWNNFLRQRYGTTEKLRQAWGRRSPSQEIGQIPSEDFNDWGQSWDDVKVYDLNLFRAALIRRWCGALIGGTHEVDTSHLTTAEFYQLPHQGVDLSAAIDGLDLANFGYFERPEADLQRFPAICKFNDLRARGKSTGPGEYGVKTHPAWGDGKDYGYHIARTREQSIELFLGIAHYSLGLGASRIHNWCWKNDAHRIFPWGLCYPCDNVPKDILYAHRNQSLLFRHFAPVYREPSVYVLTADTHRFGGGKWQVIEGILKGIDLALATHAENLGTLHEMSLDIPSSANAIYYPLPFCPPDEAYAKLLTWVRKGGVLYLSGDISYDEFRRRTRTSRLEELCGVRFLGENFPNISLKATATNPQPCIKCELTGASLLSQGPDGLPLVVEHQVGKGHVLYTPDPIELHSTPERRSSDLALYRHVLQMAGVSPLGLNPDDPLIHLFRLPLQDGGQVYVLFNTDESQPSRLVTVTTDLESAATDRDRSPVAAATNANARLEIPRTVGSSTPLRPGTGRGPGAPPRHTHGPTTAHSTVTIRIARKRPALLWFDGKGALRAVEAQGECRLGNEPLLSDETAGILLTLDGKDVRRSHALVLMPLLPGTVRLLRTSAWRHPVVETGEILDGAWRPFETAAPARRGDELLIHVNADQARSLLLLCESGDASRWRKALGRAMSDPASLP